VSISGIGGFYQIAAEGPVRLQFTTQAEQGHGYGARFGTGQTNYTYAAATGRSGDGDYGVVEVHDGQWTAVRG
jgi:hypothetical protein